MRSRFRFISDHDRAPGRVLRERRTRDGRWESYLAPVERRRIAPAGVLLFLSFLALAVALALIGGAS